MGYHVIIDPLALPIKTVYVEHFKDLLKVEGITKESIVYRGNPENTAQKVGDSVIYRNLGEPWYRAGLRAQLTFARMAKRRGLILEELSQDQESFQSYVGGMTGPIKRGDFLIRNLHNLEVEVKCRSFHTLGNQRFFYFSADDLQKHMNMQRSTQTPVVVAVYRRKEDMPVSNSLCMIRADRIFHMSDTLVSEQKDYGKVFQVPLKETIPGFRLLDEFGQEEIPIEEAGKKRKESVLENGFAGEAEPYVLVGYCKSREHLEWVVRSGWYNLRMGSDRGALRLGFRETASRYILLHVGREKVTGNLFKILEDGPRVFTREMLRSNGYPSVPAHDFYLVYRVRPVFEKELVGRKWDISVFPGYKPRWGSTAPFTVTLSELMTR